VRVRRSLATLRLLGLLVGVLAMLGCAAGTATDRPSAAPTQARAAATVQARPAVDPASGLPAVRVQDLPPEAARTLALIERGGPFRYRQDGATFQNREGLLPARRADYYREYTVDTPGSDDRGARRIVVGAGGERYWTDDHYDSFAWIAP
jgi:ribonuclease T1